jgi:hypothetical protein
MTAKKRTTSANGKVKLPAALAPLIKYPRPHWVIWKSEFKETGERTKVPYMARNPQRYAKSNDPSTWATFEEALNALRFADGAGFVLTDTYIAALDLDHCRNAESGEIHPWVSDLIDRAQSYTEVTPSREGIRIIGTANGPKLPDTKLYINDEGATCEFYRGAVRYITITGDQIGDYPIANIDAVMDAAYAELEKRKQEKQDKAADDGPAYDRNDKDEDDLDQLIRTGGDLPVGQRSDKGVYKATCEMTRQRYAPSAILSVLLDKANRISDHIYAQKNPREYALRQIEQAEKEVGKDTLRIRSIEIRPGQVETFKVSIEGGSVVVDAEALNYFPWFNRACIAQLRRSFPQMKAQAWSMEVDRALRAAREPIQLVEEQVRRHGTDTWRNEPVPWLVRERLPEQGVGLLSGMYSTFKSFVLLDLCGSVMTGLPFLKARIVRRGGVLIFAAEGASDLPMRIAALIEHRLAKESDDPDLFERNKIDLGRLPFSYVSRCRPLRDPKTVEWMVARAREEQAYFQNQFGLDLVLIGIDTMSAAAGWENENDAAQAQIVMNHLADVSKATNTFVLAADHFGKDISAGTRGSVVKEASADTILAVLGERDPETNVMEDTRIVLRKQRSGPQGEEFPFIARLVDMGEDRDGEPLTSRVIHWDVERVEKVKPEKKTEAQLLLEEALAQTFMTRSQQITVNGATIEAVKEEDLRTTFSDLYKRGKPDADAYAIKQARWRGLKKMQKAIMQESVEGVLYVWYPPTPF